MCINVDKLVQYKFQDHQTESDFVGCENENTISLNQNRELLIGRIIMKYYQTYFALKTLW